MTHGAEIMAGSAADAIYIIYIYISYIVYIYIYMLYICLYI